MKNFILKIGETLVKAGVIIGILISLVIAYSYSKMMPFAGLETKIAVFIIIAVFGVFSVIIAFFLIFLLIDIRDELRKLNAK